MTSVIWVGKLYLYVYVCAVYVCAVYVCAVHVCAVYVFMLVCVHAGVCSLRHSMVLRERF